MTEGYVNSSKNTGVRRPSTIGFGGDCWLVDVRFCPQAPNKDRARSVAFGQTPVIQTPKLGSRIMRRCRGTS